MQSLIPVTTGLARGVERLLPALAGRVTAKSIRVPVANVSAIDMVVTLGRPADAAAVNALLHRAAEADPLGVLACSDEAHASIDFNHSPHSAIIDTSQTRLAGDNMLNLLVWFDNEWGFANRMLELAHYWLSGSRLTVPGGPGAALRPAGGLPAADQAAAPDANSRDGDARPMAG
jgi:glyceraldehyde 3-phosphate dehydrogenase/D-erythrose 4-phosphate dehydrogenase